MPKLRTIQEITQEITQCVGFFPPFFEPALDSASVLDNLWQQTGSAYLTSIIPAVFKEKLGILLGQQLAVPYCLMCHASTLSPLGLKGEDILNVLTRSMPDLRRVPPTLQFLKKLPDELWPETHSDLESVLLDASLVMFFEQDDGQTAAKLKSVLPSTFFHHLILLLSYNRTSLQWIKVHPEIAYEEDQRYLVHYHRIVQEEPRLEAYFQGLLLSWKERRQKPNEAIKAFDDERRKILRERDEALNLLWQEKEWLAIEKSRREAELSESRLILAVEASQLGCWECNLRTQYCEWSETFRKQFDFPAGQYSGEQMSTMMKIHPEDRPRVADIFAACLAYDLPFHAIYRVVSTVGKISWIEGRGRFQYDEHGSMIKMLGTCLDVTETKRIQDELQLAKDNAERANEAKSAFLANMSHEIRTPLTAIMGYTDLLKEDDLSREERAGFIDIINRNGKALTKLIEDILDLSKVEAGKLVTENGHFSLRALLSDVMYIFKDAAANKGIELQLGFAKDGPDLLVTDPVRLRQILVNIIGNAVKFTSRGFVKVLSRVVSDRGQNRLKIEVDDTGIGLTREEMNRLFQPFVQADNSTSRRYGGTGLGLALSRRLASALGGNISILSSEPMRGSCFLIEIQVDIAREIDERASPPESVSLNRDVLNGVKILLVEDAPDNSLLISNMLGYYGAEVDTAGNGLDGVEMAMAGVYDLVLMDIQMPLMDGYEAFQRLKNNHYQPPIIALTAHAMLEEKRRTHELGFVAHITKPIDPMELISCVRKFSYLHRSLQSINPY